MVSVGAQVGSRGPVLMGCAGSLRAVSCLGAANLVRRQVSLAPLLRGVGGGCGDGGCGRIRRCAGRGKGDGCVIVLVIIN